jgi:hypothetical protein
MWFYRLGLKPAYTWANRRHPTTPTFERLDCCLGNAEWCTAYPNTTVYHLPMQRSDHTAILTILNSSRRKTNTPFRFENWQDRHKAIFPVPDLLPHTKHLGHPLIFNHNDRNRAYNFIHNKFRAKLTTVRANKLNHVGRLTYIQSVLASIPVYYMSTVLFSKTFLQ